MSPNPEKAPLQTPLSSGVDYGMANAFEKIGVTPASFPKEAANDPTLEKKAPRGGRGTKAGSELTALIKQTLEENKIKDRQLETELKKDEKLFDKEVERMEDVYAQFSEDVDALKKRLSEETNGKEKRRLQTLMSQAKDHLRLLRRFFPKDELGAQSEYDTEVFKSVAEKFKKYEEARRRQTAAELNLNDGGGSIGKHEQARNEAIKLREEISTLIQQGESIVAKNSAHPAQDESIGNIRTEGAETMNTMPSEINPEERLVLPPEDSAPGSLELPQQDVQAEGIEQGTRGLEDERIDTTVEALAEQAEANNLKEAVDTFENEGGRVVDADLEHTPEEHNASLPVLAEAVEETSGIQQEEKKNESRPVLNAEQINVYAEKNKLTREAALAGIERMENAVTVRAEKIGADKNIIRRVGETWNKIPTRYKLLISAGMIVSGLAVETAVAASAVATIGAGLRFAGGAGLFATFDKMFEKRAEKSGVKRSGLAEGRDKFAAAALAIVIAGILPGVVRDYAVEHGFIDKVRELFGGHTAHAEITPVEPSEIAQGQANLAATEHLNATNVPVEGGAAAEAENVKQFIKIAEAGDSRWSLAERVLVEGPYKDQFNAIASDEQRTYIIDAIKDKITAGMTTEQANALNVGDKIDFQNIFTEWDPADKGYFIDKVFSEAQNLKPEGLAHIQNYHVEVPVETPARIVSADELLGQPLLTDFTPPEQPSAAIPSPEAGKLTDSLISSNVNVPTPEEIVTPPSVVTAENVGLVSLATAATTMPQEFTPKNPQVLAYIDQQFHNDIDALFGKKGILGIGKIDGMKSSHWLDFENRTFAEIKNAPPTEGATGIGVNNSEALKKMQSYLLNVSKESKIRPEDGETAGKYIRRAMEMTASRLQTTE